MKRNLPQSFYLFAAIVCQTAAISYAQDITNLGGDLSTTISDQNALQVAAPNVTGSKRLLQNSGFEPFHKTFSKSEGLGPFFNNNSCAGCHVRNGRGSVRIPWNKKNRRHAMLVKVGLPGLQDSGAPTDIPNIGEQLQEKSINRRKRRFRVRLRWRRIRGYYPDGTRYTLRKPILRYRIRGIRRRNTVASLRMTPLLIGLGLLEAIPEAEILALSDPEDSNMDGISGRPQYIPDLRNESTALGRFGFRASHPTVEQQSGAAAFNDMGLTSDLFNPEGGETEISNGVFEALTLYQQLAGVPMARNQDDPSVIQGKSLFQEIGCNDCHVMTFETEHSEHPELDGQTIHPFTDLLLHDMGAGLEDTRAEFSASGREWRTTPLWGLGFADVVGKQKPGRVVPKYLHDGRARSIEEAILWHGGESANSRDAFMNLSEAERAALLAFLHSL